MPRGSENYAFDSKCINVGCENKAACAWKCKTCYNRDRKAAGKGVQTPEERKAYREAHKAEIAIYQAEWESDNRAHRTLYQRQRNRDNPQPNRDNVASWIKKNPEKVRDYRNKRNFGLSWEQYQAMWAEQEGKCKVPLCGRELLPTGQSSHSVAVDHDHAIKGVDGVRGLLCSKCNKGIGHFQDDPELLRSVAAYLEEYNLNRRPK